MVETTIVRRFGASRRARTHFAAALVAVLAVSLTACGGGTQPSGGGSEGTAAGGATLAKLKESGTVRIAVAEGLPIASANAKPTGYQPEMAEMVFHELGVKNVVAVPMEFSAMIPSLQSHRIDATAAGHYVTAERCKVVTFAKPSMYFMDGMAVAKGNPSNIRTYEDVAKAGLDIGFLTGSAVAKAAPAAGVDESKLHDYADLPTMLDALKAGRIGAAAETNVTIAYALSKPAYSDLSLTEPTFPTINGKPQAYAGSVAFPKDDVELAKAFGDKQQEMLEAGAFDELAKKWSLPEEGYRPTEAPTLEDICK